MTSLLDLADERFVSLTTFRRSGEPVPTPVWVARDGDGLVVITPSGSGKVKRLRHTARVELRPCGRFGKVPEGAPTLSGSAQVQADPVDVQQARDAIARAYPLESRIVLGIEAVLDRLRGKPRTTRVALRIR